MEGLIRQREDGRADLGTLFRGVKGSRVRRRFGECGRQSRGHGGRGLGRGDSRREQA